jgi:hypothetical protein
MKTVLLKSKSLNSHSISRMCWLGLNDEVCDAVETAYEGLGELIAGRKLKHQDIELILIAAFKADNENILDLVTYSLPAWSTASSLLSRILHGKLNIHEISKMLLATYSLSRNWHNQTLSQSSLLCLKIIKKYWHKGSCAKASQSLDKDVSFAKNEYSIYVSDIDIFSSICAGSATRLIDICKSNNFGYLYIGNPTSIKRPVYSGIRCYSRDVLEHKIYNCHSEPIGPKDGILRVDKFIIKALRHSRCMNLPSLLRSLFYATGRALTAAFPSAKKFCIGYAWNTFIVSGLTGDEPAPAHLFLDTHDILSSRYSDLSKYDSPCYKILEHEELALMNHYDTCIFINNEDANRLALKANKLVIYPKIHAIQSSCSQSRQIKSELIYIGGLQEANLFGLNWFANNVMRDLEGIKLSVYGSICKDFKVPADLSGKILLKGRFSDLNELANTAIIGVAPLFFGSGTKLKIIEYLSLGLNVVGTDVALYGFRELQDIYCYSANTSIQFINQIKRLLVAPQKKTQNLDLSAYLPSPKIV